MIFFPTQNHDTVSSMLFYCFFLNKKNDVEYKFGQFKKLYHFTTKTDKYVFTCKNGEPNFDRTNFSREAILYGASACLLKKKVHRDIR